MARPPPTTVALTQVAPFLRRRRRSVAVQTAVAALATAGATVLTVAAIVVAGVLPGLGLVISTMICLNAFHHLRREQVVLAAARMLAARDGTTAQLHAPDLLELTSGRERVRLRVAPGQLAGPPAALPAARVIRDRA